MQPSYQSACDEEEKKEERDRKREEGSTIIAIGMAACTSEVCADASTPKSAVV